MIPPIRRQPVPAECATPPRPPRYRTPGPGRGPHPPSWRRLPARFAHPSPAAPAPTPRTRSRTAPILPRHRSAPGPPRDTPDEKGSVSLSHRERRARRPVMMVRAGAGRCGRGCRRGPRRPRPVRFFAEMCILHSRMTVGTALSSAKCTFRRRAGRGPVTRSAGIVRLRPPNCARPSESSCPPSSAPLG